jgi:hypothetical protein
VPTATQHPCVRAFNAVVAHNSIVGCAIGPNDRVSAIDTDPWRREARALFGALVGASNSQALEAHCAHNCQRESSFDRSFLKRLMLRAALSSNDLDPRNS